MYASDSGDAAVQIFEEGKIKVQLCNAIEVMNQNENMKN